MKILYTFSLIIAIQFSASAQRISYADLLFSLKHNIALTDEYLSKKGFSFYEVDTLTNLSKQVNYIFTKNPSRSPSFIGISKKSIRNIFFEVSVFTVVKSDYLKLKSSIKINGFNLLGTEVEGGDLSTVYKKGHLKISFWQHRKQEDANDYMEYYISLSDTNLISKLTKVD